MSQESFKNRYGAFPSTEIADSGYGAEENYRFMEERGIEAFVKYNRFHIEQRPRYVQDPFRSENFYYNEKEDYCVCPMGQHMNRIGQKRGKTASGYISVRHRYQARNCNEHNLDCFKFIFYLTECLCGHLRVFDNQKQRKLAA